MGYDDKPEGEAQRVGQAIYKNALAHRRGFRPDQLNIPEDDAIWGEIFEDLGLTALEALTSES